MEQWADKLEQEVPGVHVLGCDADHGTFECEEVLLDSVRVFLGTTYQIDENTTGVILCDAVELD